MALLYDKSLGPWAPNIKAEQIFLATFWTSSVKIVFLVHCRFFLRWLVWLPCHNGKPRGDFLKGLRIRLIVLDEFKARRFVRFRFQAQRFLIFENLDVIKIGCTSWWFAFTRTASLKIELELVRVNVCKTENGYFMYVAFILPCWPHAARCR